VKYLNETKTVSCYNLYISSEGTLQLSIQEMWTVDSSHFVTLLTRTHKYLTTLFFTERPIGSFLPPHALASNSHRAFRKSLVWIPLVFFMGGGGSLFVNLKNL